MSTGLFKRLATQWPIDRVVKLGRRQACRTGALLRDLRVPVPPPAWIVFHENYVTAFDSGPRHAFDGRRPVRIMAQLRRAGLVSRSQMLQTSAVELSDLTRVHPPGFLAEIQEPERIAELLSIPANRILEHEAPLESFYYQAGGTVLALRKAIVTGIPAFNLGGGFHHAQRDRAEGFCPFNDIAVAIERMRSDGLARRFLVVDLDFHHGNGTALIYAKDEDVFTLSIHGQAWAHIEAKRNVIDVDLPSGTGDADYMRAIREALCTALRRFEPDAAIYLAGADPFETDQLGDFRISEDGMLDRDLFVWQLLRDANIPFAVVLAGGYGPFAWTIPYNFIYSALTGTRIPPSQRPGNVEAQYRRIKEQLGPAELRMGEDSDLSEAELHSLMTTRRATPLFMGTYTEEGLRFALQRYGFLDLLAERGFGEPICRMDTSDPNRQTVRIYADKEDRDQLLIELILRFRRLAQPTSTPFAPQGQRMLSIEWLCMENPRADFTLDRPALPGQRRPGLGLARWMFELLRMMAERLGCAGMINNPDRYHNAYLYSRAVRFYDPVLQGRFRALVDLLEPLGMVEAARAMEQRRVVDLDGGQPIQWEGHPQVLGFTPEITDYLTGQPYRDIAQATTKASRLHLETGTGSPPTL